MTPGMAPYGRAVETLRAQLAEGVLSPGENLVIGDLAKRLRLSPTPVREALARLAGEGLVEDRRGKGYFTWPATASELADLYRLRMGLLAFALESRVPRPSGHPQPSNPAAPPDMARELFLQIIAEVGNGALQAAYRRLDERLAPFRRGEGDLLGDAISEVSALWSAFARDDISTLAAGLRAHHQRLVEISGMLAADRNSRKYK